MKERVRRTRWSLISRFQSSGSSDRRKAARVVILPSTLLTRSGSSAMRRRRMDTQVLVVVDVQAELVSDIGEGEVVWRRCQ